MSKQHIIEGVGAPTMAPPSRSAHYTDTANGDQYMAKGTASAADWFKIGAGVEGWTVSNTGSVASLIAAAPAGTPAARVDAVIGGINTGGLRATTDGNARGVNSVDLQSLRADAAKVASGEAAVIGGGNDNTASGRFATVAGGDGNIASGNWSTVGGGSDNKAEEFAAFVGGGELNRAVNNNSTVGGGGENVAGAALDGGWEFIGGGYQNQCDGYAAAMLGGDGNIVHGEQTAMVGGYGNKNDSDLAVVLGGMQAHTRGVRGVVALGAAASNGNPVNNYLGRNQAEKHLVTSKTTTGSNAAVLNTGGNGDALAPTLAKDVLTLPDNGVYQFKARVLGATAADASAWEITGLIRRGTGAATTALVGTPTVSMQHQSAGASAWTVAAVADATYGALTFSVTGATDADTRWIAEVDTVEMVL